MKKIVIILCIFLVIPLGLTIHHLITKQKPTQYLTEEAKCYVAFDSIREFYDDIIDLKALEIVLTTDSLKDFYTLLTDFKSNSLSDSFLFKQILKLKVFTILHEDLTPSLIIDPGMKGVITRFFPLFINRLNSEDIQIINSTIEGKKVYTIVYKEETEYYLIFDQNLIILSLTKDNIKSLLTAKSNKEGVKIEKELTKLKEYKVKDSILELYVDIDSLLPEDQALFEFPSLAAVSVNLTNEKVDLQGFTEIKPLNEKIKGLMDHRASSIDIIKSLPNTTNIYTALNFKSFRDVYEVITVFYKDIVIDDYEFLIKTLSTLSSDDLIFNWTGSEAGFFTMETAAEPVIFIDIADKNKLDVVLKSLNDSLILNITDNLVIDNNRISQFSLPKVIEKTLDLAKKSSSLPYFIIDGNYLLLSMNPELLSQFLTKKANSELLIEDKTYRSITKRSPKNANLFVYYDLNSTLPRFLASNNSLITLFKEYKKGVITASYTMENITVSLNAESSITNRTSLFPGYPKEIKDISSPIVVYDITGGASKEFIYTTKDNNLVISDINATTLSKTQVGRDSNIIPDNKKLIVIDKDGVIYNIGGEGDILKPSPFFSVAKNSFPPLLVGNNLLMYSSINKTVGFYSKTGEIKGEIESNKQIFNRPAILDDKIFYYPKSLFGTIEAATKTGEPVEGWPQKAMGVSFSGPVIIDNKVAFLTQKGDLFIWNKKGELLDNFPVNLDGVFYSSPVVLNNKTLGIINGDGLLYLVDVKGEVIHKRELERFAGRDTKLTVYDGNIYIYGGTNFIAGLNDKLQLLPGFPVKGYYKPSFHDINGDDSVEMISPGYDNKLYVYTIRG